MLTNYWDQTHIKHASFMTASIIATAHLQIQRAQAGSVGTKLKVCFQLEAEAWECWESSLSSEIPHQRP